MSKKKSELTSRFRNVVKKLVKPFFNPLLKRFEKVNKEIKVLDKKFEGLNNKSNMFVEKQFFDDYASELSQKIDNCATELAHKLEFSNERLLEYEERLSNMEDNELLGIDSYLYFHGGSGNHGCEALIKTISKACDLKKDNTALYSYKPVEDKKWGIADYVRIIRKSNLTSCDLTNIKHGNNVIALSIGGDNYCYGDYGRKCLAEYNKKFNENNVKTALIGCSINPEYLENREVLDDLNQYSLITARETTTYEALLKKGIKRNTHLIPDTAFLLEKVELPLPLKFKIGKTIGLNISNVVSNTSDLVYQNFYNLIEYIIQNTDYQIALIPHVMQEENFDKKALEDLYHGCSNQERVLLVQEHLANEIKGFIARCEMFIGARTHATIAAYSSCVPTLAIGYSVKSLGIAKDLFGSSDNYVLSINDLKSENELIDGFIWLEKNRVVIQNQLKKIIPAYQKNCLKLKDLIRDLRQKASQRVLPNNTMCTGCTACQKMCPVSAITMIENKNGFSYPNTDYTKCTNCGLCREKCPVNDSNHELLPINVYAAKNKNSKVVKNSSSGGIFSLLATPILNKKGVVYGAIFVNGEVKHIKVKEIEALPSIQRSKYVQSNISGIFEEVKKDLMCGIHVLFSGTPCQIAGLKAFLKQPYLNLITVDFICHGVPSPKVLSKYLKSLEKSYNSSCEELNFRDKTNGWANYNFKVKFKNGKVFSESFTENAYMKAFLKDLTIRPCCSNCNFKNGKNYSDITLGDYWGINAVHPDFSDNKGVSAVIINTTKGQELFNEIREEISMITSNIDAVKIGNPVYSRAVQPNPEQGVFFDQLDEVEINELLKQFND